MKTKVRSEGDGRSQGNIHAYETAPIAAIFEDCLQCFERLSGIIEVIQEADKAQYPMIEGSFSKFRQWGSDTGTPKRSLDHALRKAPQLQQATVDLLSDLLSSLHIGKAVSHHGLYAKPLSYL